MVVWCVLMFVNEMREDVWLGIGLSGSGAEGWGPGSGAVRGWREKATFTRYVSCTDLVAMFVMCKKRRGIIVCGYRGGWFCLGFFYSYHASIFPGARISFAVASGNVPMCTKLKLLRA